MPWPEKFSGGRLIEDLTSVIDLAPTLLDAAGVVVPESMPGKSLLPALLGESDDGMRQYAFSERNWHDCDEHMRSVRTKNFKLIHNAYLDRVYGNPADVMRSPSAESLRAAHAAGTAEPRQVQMFDVPRPEWELYDLRTDPYEFTNLADDPEYADMLSELREVLDAWSERTGDFPPERRQRDDIADRMTGVMHGRGMPPLRD